MNVSQGVLIIALVLLGALARTILPYLQVLRECPDTPFDRKYWVPLIASVLTTLITIPLAIATIPPNQFISELTISSGVIFFLAGYGFNSVARDVQKAAS
jgi:hypothetical protein